MNASKLTVILFSLHVSVALADNYQLEHVSSDGWVVAFDTEPPATVAVYRRLKDGSLANYVAYESEGCVLSLATGKETMTKSTFSCPATGKSPLAGTTYVYDRHVGLNCFREPFYDMFICTKGCKLHKKTPKTLRGSGYCC